MLVATSSGAICHVNLILESSKSGCSNHALMKTIWLQQDARSYKERASAAKAETAAAAKQGTDSSQFQISLEQHFDYPEAENREKSREETKSSGYFQRSETDGLIRKSAPSLPCLGQTLLKSEEMTCSDCYKDVASDPSSPHGMKRQERNRWEAANIRFKKCLNSCLSIEALNCLEHGLQ
ncbi:hypothetical protein JRQ81_014552 [Phrynocephalus forsythii]|uniref:Uncharacterized protein n=1 Tax=Phrynocephalus forsythii TaxID=171643 RepID=A0A9Q1B2Y5_9SAUR|nr:hypothetical protein JRQ81_014552 [Phrynocephalus forsythii]